MKRTILTIALSLASLTAYAQSPIYKCQVKGKTIYSESPCAVGTNKQTVIDTTPEYMGNHTYDRATIEAARARIRAGMNDRGTGVASTGTPMRVGAGTVARNASPSQRDEMCNWVKNEITNLESWARSPQGGYSQDWLKQRKVEVQKISYDWAC